MSSLSFVIVSVLNIGIVIATCPAILKRAEWGARPALSTSLLRQEPAPFVLVHHSDTPQCINEVACKTRLHGIQNYHMDQKGWDDIGYNFMIGGDGTIFEGRGWGLTGAHAVKYNSLSIGICLLGNFQETNPSAAQLMALESLIECGVKEEKIHGQYRLMGHRQVSATACPGNKLFRVLSHMPNFVRT
ncbi:peptidoglycan-recognition protein 2-like [Sitophilus oryzae]|uniref:Peptidoglycan-recognition protein n=1 Tax=Sitophilus oryzae TaxID=7048 RepID=A0A6J2XC99_SITOR|nr:peptidoglycan-recognition protein 2-like [Sitophilus oryzae]